MQRQDKTVVMDREFAQRSIQTALEHHRAGRLAEAEKIYREVLDVDSDNADALHLLGVLAHQIGDDKAAVRLIENALQIRPSTAIFLNNLGEAYSGLSRLAEAEKSFRQALALDGDYALAYINLGVALHKLGRLGEAEQSYRQALRLRPDVALAHNNLGNVLRDRGDARGALGCYERALELDGGFAEARKNVSRIYERIVPRWHFSMMNDARRNRLFDNALRKAVKKESLVLDIGTGGGLLAMMAARAGARHVVTCEKSDLVAQAARTIIERNGFHEVISVVNKESTQLTVGRELPRRANVLVAEIFDAGLLGEGAIAALSHARRELLTPDATIIPLRATVYGMLIEAPEILSKCWVQNENACGFDLNAFNRFAKRSYEQIELRHHNFVALSGGSAVFDFNFGEAIAASTKTVEFKIENQGTVHAIAFWFKLWLDDENCIDTGPDAEAGTHWHQAIQFFTHFRRVGKSDIFRVRASHDGREIVFAEE